MDSLLCLWSGLLSIEYPRVARAARQSQLWKSAKPRFRHHLLFFFFFFFKRLRARLVGPETMIQSPNCFTLPCTGHFHKINCELYLPNVWLLLRHHFTKLTRDKRAALRMYACAHMRVAAYTAFIRELRKICGTSAKRMNMDVGMHHAKNRGNKEIPLAIISTILAQSCVTLPT